MSNASRHQRPSLTEALVLKPGSRIIVIVVIIGNRKQVQADSERNLSQLLQLICSLYA